jgi:hypothetical protein
MRGCEMKLRHKEKGYMAQSSSFNTSSISEIVVYYEEGDCDSSFIKEWDVWLKDKQEWKDLRKAFEDHDVITDNYNTIFFAPPTPEDRERGYTIG